MPFEGTFNDREDQFPSSIGHSSVLTFLFAQTYCAQELTCQAIGLGVHLAPGVTLSK